MTISRRLRVPRTQKTPIPTPINQYLELKEGFYNLEEIVSVTFPKNKSLLISSDEFYWVTTYGDTRDETQKFLQARLKPDLILQISDKYPAYQTIIDWVTNKKTKVTHA
jgi:hypothetical protein